MSIISLDLKAREVGAIVVTMLATFYSKSMLGMCPDVRSLWRCEPGHLILAVRGDVD